MPIDDRFRAREFRDREFRRERPRDRRLEAERRRLEPEYRRRPYESELTVEEPGVVEPEGFESWRHANATGFSQYEEVPSQIYHPLSPGREEAASERPAVTKEPFAWQPAVDLFEYDGYWLLEVELPGADEDDVSIVWEDEALTIEGEVAKHDREHLYHRERRTGRFVRRILIPERVNVDRAETSYRNGILEILIPRAGWR